MLRYWEVVEREEGREKEGEMKWEIKKENIPADDIPIENILDNRILASVSIGIFCTGIIPDVEILGGSRERRMIVKMQMKLITAMKVRMLTKTFFN